MNIFIVSFIILTILHPLADFWFGGNRRLHYFVALNPLHWLWDISPFRRHQNYTRTSTLLTNEWGEIPVLLTMNKFWKLLAIDQLAHVLLNLIVALFLEVLI